MTKEELRELVEESPEILVVGTGIYGDLSLAEIDGISDLLE